MSSPAVPRVILKPRRALPFFSRHPWVFAGAIHRIEGGPQPEDEVLLATAEGETIARGLFNPHSNLRVRLYSWEPERPLDADFFSERIDAAVALRRRLFPEADHETAFRVIFSEGDGLSGLTVDRYGNCLVLQITSLALAARREMLVDLLKRKLRPAGIWLRTEKGIRESEGLEIADGLVDGEPPPRPLFIREGELRFGVDIVEGQKTGFFLDQRDNRRTAAQYASGRVLDVFCYSGAFGIAAAANEAVTDVLGIDVSEPALTLARANAELNGVAARLRFERGRAFETMQRLAGEGRRFDTVILDPPKMARHRRGLAKALRGYHQLNRLAVELLAPNGVLVSCSCSGLVGRAEFESMLADVAAQTGRPIQFLESRGQSPDHPVSASCLESAYLKCYICRIV